MAVHTVLSDKDFTEILMNYDVGHFVAATAIADGIENSNYFLETNQGSYVLTLFEEIPAEELSPYLALLTFAQTKNLKVAAPLLTNSGTSFIQIQNLHSKPCILTPRLQGSHLTNPTAAQRKVIAAELARFHLCTADYSAAFTGIRSLHWLVNLAQQYHGSNREIFLDAILQFQQLALPNTMTHGDLFMDNCLFLADELSGMIDFFNAGYAPALFDLAILICAWCKTPQHALDIQAALDIISTYSSIRPLNSNERNNLLLALRVAAIRFYLSRSLFPSTKKPEDFRLLLNDINRLNAKDLYL